MVGWCGVACGVGCLFVGLAGLAPWLSVVLLCLACSATATMLRLRCFVLLDQFCSPPPSFRRGGAAAGWPLCSVFVGVGFCCVGFWLLRVVSVLATLHALSSSWQVVKRLRPMVVFAYRCPACALRNCSFVSLCASARRQSCTRGNYCMFFPFGTNGMLE